MIRRTISAAFAILLAAHATAGAESINAGGRDASADRPFVVDAVAEFDTPWAIGFLPDGRMLVTEKPGRMFLVTQGGEKTPVGDVPEVAASGQVGLLDIAAAPDFAKSARIYFSYVEPADGSTRLVLASATLSTLDGGVRLIDQKAIWRQTPAGGRGHPGGIIAFDPEGQHLFLTVGERQLGKPAQDPRQARGKLLRLNLDGSTPSDNPQAAQGGVPAQTWTTGHRNPYGLAFAADGKLWLHEMGPRGGDEFNLIAPGKNYGWPIVSNGDNYDGTPIPRHASRPEFEAPLLYWNPIIAPAGLAFYNGEMFPQWRGSALVGGLAIGALLRIGFGPEGQPDEADRWEMGERIRDVAVAPDGAVWLIEDSEPGRLLRLTPK
ncbi:PQQ-dependent sugar dehydrogenase [Dongia sedimenti]|uniref:PQQ-dependent sugar dehydrogenase n=1 Tax=Dongia sedimenti TaxID=3064282 RepID=A0ABU0YQJ5_9PROT|nr:PQQ-dependent sugar dehydrogenase [Rhodospirillaceae bacterium R-7]